MSGPRKKKKVNRKYWYQYIVLLPLYLLLRLWQATIRLDMSEEARAILEEKKKPQIFIFWHTYLFSCPIVQRRIRRNAPIRPLISASKDGAWLDAILRINGMKAVRGSANFRGAQSLKELIKVVREGVDIGITPDGSKGPPYILKPGTAGIAKACKCGITLLSAEHTSAWRLNTWDYFYLPKPFSKITVSVEFIDSYADLGEDDPHEASKILQKKLMALQKPDPLVPMESDH